MKKSLLLLSLMFLTLMVTAQKYQIYEVKYGKWDDTKKNYDYGSALNRTMELDLDNNVVDITDIIRSSYRVTNRFDFTENNKPSVYAWDGVWDAIDVQNKKCKIICRVYQDLKVAKYTIMYDDVSFQYSIKIN